MVPLNLAELIATMLILRILRPENVNAFEDSILGSLVEGLPQNQNAQLVATKRVAKLSWFWFEFV